MMGPKVSKDKILADELIERTSSMGGEIALKTVCKGKQRD